MVRSDAELLRAWREGDRRAGEELFERYYGSVARFFVNKVSSDPADLVQETFAACVTGQERIREDQNFRAYLYGVAHNVLKRHYSKRRRQDERVDFGTHTAMDLAPGPSTMMAQGAEQQLLLDALRRIPLEHQIVLELFYWEGMTSATIAEVLEEPHGTVRTRIRRARQLLEEAMQPLSKSERLVSETLGDLEGWAAKIREHAPDKAPGSEG